ncbi:MAG: primosomal protein N' [Syntrophobacteraceae bacterium]
MMADMFAEVIILGSAFDKSLHYSISPQFSGRTLAGSRVAVELGKRKVAAIILSVSHVPPELPENVTLRPILHLIDEEPVIPPDLLQLCRWISRYYFYPFGEVLDLVVPLQATETVISASHKVSVKTVHLVRSISPDSSRMPEKAREILRLLVAAGGFLPLRDLRKSCANSDYSLRKLARDGIILIEQAEADPDCGTPVDSRQATPPFELTAHQQESLDEILPLIEMPAFVPFVLYGVTGSGKTEIYLRLIEQALVSGGDSLVMVPEIALSTQMETIFRERFGSLLAVWHSALPGRERRRQWADIVSGKRRVVLGARSAVLTPLRNLRLIIIDEEHDTSYKQEDRLRYNARDVALMRGKTLGVPVVMGSATPSLTTMYRCSQGQYRTLLLPSRIMDRPHPEFEIVDMRREGGRGGMFSMKLREGIAETLQRGQQTLLFLNRRGFAKYFLCNSCGHTLQCVSCSVTLTYHKGDDCLRCHYCGWETHLPDRCPACAHAALFPHGFGTEKVEKELKNLFPEARVVRMDRDTMSSYDRLVDALDEVKSGKADILLGTQMVAKGHDFPNITLVGIINADAGLQVPDFRAGETLVQLLLQVAGRAGRGDEPGRVILQSFNPFHFTIESALRLDYDGFCDAELKSRKMLQYPPFSRLLKILVTANAEESAQSGARLLSALSRKKAETFRSAGRHIAVMGPAPAAFVKLKNRFRWQIFIKTWTSSDMQDFVGAVLESVKGDPNLRSVQITIDRDPSNES